MSRSFFTGNDAELYSGSAAFSAQITATPTAFGLTAPLAAEYAALNDAYAAAWLAATDPEQRTKGKVREKNSAKVALRRKASELAKLIDGTASVTDAQRDNLGLSVRNVPGPVGNPATPTSCVAEFTGDGSVRLKWKCENPRGCIGVMYQVWRKAGAGEFEFLGGVGEKKFVDNTIPPGASPITYKVQAVRSTSASDWATFVISFGAASGGMLVSDTTPVKIAA